MTSLKKLKQQAWSFYSQWRKETTFCPALKTNVQVSLKGWNHLIGQSKFKKRSPGDLYRRLMLLPQAKDITINSHTVQNITRKNNKVFYVLEAVMPNMTKGCVGLSKVRVLYIKTKDEKFIFYSVMDRKID